MMTPELAKFIAQELKAKDVGGCIVGDFIASGGTAAVLAAERGGTPVALKVYSKELVNKNKEANLERLRRQNELRDHNHPNLIRIFDAGDCPNTGYLYVVMERITAPTLEDVLLDIPRTKIREILTQLSSAAFYLHERKLVHRDIKPANIALRGPSFDVTLLDLGVVRPLEGDTITDESSGRRFLGTRRYSPPEFTSRAEGHTGDDWEAVTFYQIGAVLHDLITRKRLFDELDNSNNELDRAILFTTPQIHAEDVPQDLLKLARDCLQKDPLLRRKFVSWQRLLEPDGSKPASERVSAALTRLAARSRESKLTQPSRDLILKHATEFANNTLDQTIDAVLRAVCLDTSLFPPLSVSPAQETSASTRTARAWFHYEFNASFPFYVILTLQTRILDAPTLAVELRLACSVSDCEPGIIADLPLARNVFNGTLDQPSLHSVLSHEIPIAVEEALSTAERLTKPPQSELFIDLVALESKQ